MAQRSSNTDVDAVRRLEYPMAGNLEAEPRVVSGGELHEDLSAISSSSLAPGQEEPDPRIIEVHLDPAIGAHGTEGGRAQMKDGEVTLGLGPGGELDPEFGFRWVERSAAAASVRADYGTLPSGTKR